MEGNDEGFDSIPLITDKQQIESITEADAIMKKTEGDDEGFDSIPLTDKQSIEQIESITEIESKTEADTIMKKTEGDDEGFDSNPLTDKQSIEQIESITEADTIIEADIKNEKLDNNSNENLKTSSEDITPQIQDNSTSSLRQRSRSRSPLRKDLSSRSRSRSHSPLISSSQCQVTDPFIVRLYGLPWEVKNSDIETFFDGLNILSDGIYICTEIRSGSSSRVLSTGEGFVSFASQDDFDKALLRDNNHIGHRYINVLAATPIQLERAKTSSQRRSSRYKQEQNRGNNSRSSSSYIVRMRGLPFTCSEEDIREFFTDYNPLEIHLLPDRSGRASGDGFAIFRTLKEQKGALSRDRDYIGSRYVELFEANSYELDDALAKASSVRSGWGNTGRRNEGSGGSGRYNKQHTGGGQGYYYQQQQPYEGGRGGSNYYHPQQQQSYSADYYDYYGRGDNSGGYDYYGRGGNSGGYDYRYNDYYGGQQGHYQHEEHRYPAQQVIQGQQGSYPYEQPPPQATQPPAVPQQYQSNSTTSGQYYY